MEWPKQLKKTKQRTTVLSILEDQSLPISAKELHEKALDQIHDIDLSTVYRILDAFEAHQIVQRTILHLPDKDLAVFELHQKGHHHYAVCTKCLKIIPIQNCPMHHFKPDFNGQSFMVSHHELTLYGICEDCMFTQ